MLVTLLLSVVLMAALLLLLYAATALIQDKRLLCSAPKDIHEAMTDHEERFPGARVLGWILLIVSAGMFLGAIVYAGWDGFKRAIPFGVFWEDTSSCCTWKRRLISCSATGFC